MSSPAHEQNDEFFTDDRFSGRAEAVKLSQESYAKYLFDLQDPQLAPYREVPYQQFSDERAENPFLAQLLEFWEGLYREPFAGLTSDGRVREGIFALDPEGSNDPALIQAAEHAFEVLGPEKTAQLRYDIDAPQWRAWSNPEFVVHRVGLRLEEQDEAQVAALLGVVEASLSEEGYAQVREAMALNGFLGELVQLPQILNEHSYWFAIYGNPSADQPWGWQLFGHHVALNFMTVNGQHTLAPVFLGAEPALSDGERQPIFDVREELALQLAGSLSEYQAAKAVVYASVLDPQMPEGRLHPADERHVAGAFRDNRVVPYEGINLAELQIGQRELVWGIVEDFLKLLRAEQRSRILEVIRSFEAETWFSWYGATDGSTPSYLRIHGPAIIVELDHHAGVWLSNRLPARFHIHATLRLANGNDYGKGLLAQWKELAKG